MTRVLALAGQSKIGCITQRRFAKVGTKPHPQRGADLDRNGLSVSTETACRFEPKSPVGNSEICTHPYLLFRIFIPDARLDTAKFPDADSFVSVVARPQILPQSSASKTGADNNRLCRFGM